MNDDVTRFERAIEMICETADRCFRDNKSVFLILADESPEFIAEDVTEENKDELFDLLYELTGDYKEHCYFGSANIKSALALAESVSSLETILFTGTDYQETNNIQVVNVSDSSEWNAAILDASTKLVENYYMIEVDVACYGRDAMLDVSVYVNGVNYDERKLGFSSRVACTNNETWKIVFIDEELYSENNFDQENTTYYLLEQDERIYSYQSIFIYIEENDSLTIDNVFHLYGGEKPIVRLQYASGNPNMFISSALMSMRTAVEDYYDVQIYEVKKGGEYDVEGFDFYIFENISPNVMPTDGVVMLMNPSRVPQGLSLTIGDTQNGSFSFEKGILYKPIK